MKGKWSNQHTHLLCVWHAWREGIDSMSTRDSPGLTMLSRFTPSRVAFGHPPPSIDMPVRYFQPPGKSAGLTWLLSQLDLAPLLLQRAASSTRRAPNPAHRGPPKPQSKQGEDDPGKSTVHRKAAWPDTSSPLYSTVSKMSLQPAVVGGRGEGARGRGTKIGPVGNGHRTRKDRCLA